MANTEALQVNQLTVKVDGKLLEAEWLDELLEVEVDSTYEMPDMFIMTFKDDDLHWLEGSTFDIGKSIEISFTTDEADSFETLVKGEVTAIEPQFNSDYSAYFIVRGFDRSHRLNRATSSTAYVNQTDSDIVKKLGGAAGLSVTADSTTTVRENVIQHSQTNLAFIHQLARLNGCEVFVDDKKLYFKKGGTGRGGTTISLKWGDSLHKFNPRLSAANQINEVQVKGWDQKTKKAIIGKATSSKSHPSTGAGGSGGTVAKGKFGAAVHVEVRRPVIDQKHADAIAQSILDEVNSTFVEAEGSADGNPKIMAGAKIKLDNVGKKFNGTYLITSARHIYAGGQYVTRFSVMGPRPRLISELVGSSSVSTTEVPDWGGVYPAIVTNINDPDKKGRIKVKYPWLDDKLESGWMRVMSIGGGAQRGLLWLPEVNDEVLVMFEHGDFNHPFMVGGLHNGKDKMPETKAVENGKVELRTIKTREGHIVRFTDKSGSQKIEIIDAKQNTKIVMDTQNKKITITSKGDFQVDADGNVTINAKGNGTIDVKKNATIKVGQSATIQASQSVTVKGASITVQASGALTLKGATVTIQSSGTLTMKSTAIMNIQSSAILNVKGTLLNLN
ncbi:MAG: VgrG-related protein [Chloroflexota bacterium]